MSFEDLVKARVIEPVEATDEEVAQELTAARHDFATARKMLETDLDWTFAIVYSGLIHLTVALMLQHGFRPGGRERDLNAIKFLAQSLPEDKQLLAKRLEKMRKKRNAAIYRKRGLVSETEAADIMDFAGRYEKHVKANLSPNVIALSNKEE